MTRLQIDYSKSSIYRLVFNHDTHYVGSTTSISKWKSQHKTPSKNEKHVSPLYLFIRESGGRETGWDMVLIENFPAWTSSEELRQRERFVFLWRMSTY